MPSKLDPHVGTIEAWLAAEPQLTAITVLTETPIASAIAGCVIPLSRSNTIWVRSRCAASIFHRSAVFSCRICFLVHLTIRPPESDSQSESYHAIECEPEKDPKTLDSISYGGGMRSSAPAEQLSQALKSAWSRITGIRS